MLGCRALALCFRFLLAKDATTFIAFLTDFLRCVQLFWQRLLFYNFNKYSQLRIFHFSLLLAISNCFLVRLLRCLRFYMQFQHLLSACHELFCRWYNRSVGIWNWFAVGVAAAASATFVCLLVCLFESAVLRKYIDVHEREREREQKREKKAKNMFIRFHYALLLPYYVDSLEIKYNKLNTRILI